VDELKYLTLLIQGGSFALIAGIAAWLMKWIPARFAQADTAAKEDHAARTALVQGFREEARYEREQCQRQFEILAEGIAQQRESAKAERDQCQRHFDVMAAGLDLQREVMGRMASTLDQSVVLLREHHAAAQAVIGRIMHGDEIVPPH
jgi:plasmid stabilization system protein ParE